MPSRSIKPNAEIIVKRQEPSDTSALVRIPAACSRLSRSNPTTVPRTSARPSRRRMVGNVIMRFYPFFDGLTLYEAAHHAENSYIVSTKVFHYSSYTSVTVLVRGLPYLKMELSNLLAALLSCSRPCSRRSSRPCSRPCSGCALGVSLSALHLYDLPPLV